MKLMIAGDLHGDLQVARDLSKKALSNNVDLVILSGDISYFGKHYDGLIGSFVSNGLKVALLHGNHEDESLINFLSKRYDVINLHNNFHIQDNVCFFGCGGANIGYNAFSESEIFEILVNTHEDLKKVLEDSDIKKIMVTHVHPSDSKIELFSGFVRGSSGVKKAIQELNPNYLFCSHVHEADGLEELIGSTKVFCVGKKSKIIDL